jgi:pimeloyl-ACP methyl ester carboxylesterase
MARVADALRAVTDTAAHPVTEQTAVAAAAQVWGTGREGERADRSPVPAILGSTAAGVAVALALVFGPASDGSEPSITGCVLLAFSLGWGLMAYTTTRFSSQRQTWMLAPATGLGLVGLALVVGQPGAAAMDLLSWIWPPVLAAAAIWMVAQARANLRGRGRWLIFPVIATLALSAIGGGLATLAGVAGRSDAPQTGQLIDVGGRQLYIECQGTGSPVVIMQASLGGSAADWRQIAPTVAASTTVCAYDRAGHGWSDPAAAPQDGTAIATDLHVLLERAGIAGPYVLVGHSSGGPYMRVFAARYPDEVAGMVLLDAQPADAFTALPDYPNFYGPYRAVMTLAPSLSRVGVGILVLGSRSDPAGVRTARSMRDEIVALPEALRQAQALETLGDRPLVVLSAGSEIQAGWSTAQERMAHLSTNAAHRVIPTATHQSVLVGRVGSASAQAILDVVASVRTGSTVR